MVARVALNGLTFGIDKLYDYLVPPGLEQEAAAGKRVSVPFARGNRRQEGLVFSLEPESDYPKLKPLDAFLDPEPVLDEAQLRLARWMKARFFCTYFEAAKAMLPAGLFLRADAVCMLCKPEARAEAYAAVPEKSNEKRLLDLLYELEGSAPLQAITLKLGEAGVEAVTELEKLGLATRILRAHRQTADKVTTLAHLRITDEEALLLAEKKQRSAPQQAALLRLLTSLGEASVKELRYYTGASLQTVRTLAKAELIELCPREEYRRPVYAPGTETPVLQLNPQQQVAYEGLKSMLTAGQAGAALLYGVTGSGKTSVYIHLIRDALEAGRQALVLVPEIALTPQLMSLFFLHFGDRVAVLHSALTATQRYDEWKRIRGGLVDVVVGTRSAVFAPLDRLGLLVIDEEQEASYQSDNAPRYHARDVAKYRCVEANALLLLASATPAVESMYEARRGRYRLFRMDQRYNTRPLPQVFIADMKQELQQGNGSCLSSLLCRELESNLAAGEQSILFINRRGMSHAVSCPACGFRYGCPNCSAWLTYHAANRRMMCHYCGYSQTPDTACPSCGGLLSYTGVGTQKVEETLRERYGDLGILRMDADTVSAAHPHEAILRTFSEKRVPVLLGTQMITKGLNFDNVTLVGVIAADQSLYAGDYRAQERTFSLITQVVGRSGRGEKTGRAVIQTYTPRSPVILSASRQDYDAFYAAELETRRLLLAPPIRGLYAMTVSGAEEMQTIRCASLLRDALRLAAAALPELRILGPAPAGLVKLNNRYRYRVILNGPPSRELRALIAAALRRFQQDKRFRGLAIYGESNPQT